MEFRERPQVIPTRHTGSWNWPLSADLLVNAVARYLEALEQRGHQEECAHREVFLPRRGGYPTPAYDLPTAEQRSVWFNGYLRTYLQRDVPDISAIDNIPAFETILRMMAVRTGTLVNQTQVARDASSPQTTVQRYIAVLEASCQVQRLPAYAVKRTKQLVKSPKFYWSDVGMALFLSREHMPRREHLESLVAAELFAWRGAHCGRRTGGVLLAYVERRRSGFCD